MARQRKFVFVLGAGASRGAGATARVQGGGSVPIPTQADFWQTLLRFCRRPARLEIETYLFRYFLGYARVPARLGATDRAKLLGSIDVEEVFTFISERARAPSTGPQARAATEKVWKTLVSAVGNVFSRFTANAETRSVYDSLRNNQFRARDAVVSFNYDTVFESSLIRGVPWKYGGLEDTTRAIPVLKPHGSINWEVGVNGHIAVRNAGVAAPVIVAPTHLKFVSYAQGALLNTEEQRGASKGYLEQSNDLQRVWAEMEGQMRAARAIVFIGYSFPAADLYFSSVLRSVLAFRGSNPDVVVVNPDAIAIASRLKQRFSLDNVARYFDLKQYADVSRYKVIQLLERKR